MNERTVALDLRDVPEKILRAVERDSERSDLSANAVVVRALSEATNYPVDVSGYPAVSRSRTGHLFVRMPEGLRAAIRVAAKQEGATMTAFVYRTLAARYRLALPPAEARRPPRFDTRTTNEIRRRHQGGESIRSLARRYSAKRETIARVVRAEG